MLLQSLGGQEGVNLSIGRSLPRLMKTKKGLAIAADRKATSRESVQKFLRTAEPLLGVEGPVITMERRATSGDNPLSVLRAIKPRAGKGDVILQKTTRKAGSA